MLWLLDGFGGQVDPDYAVAVGFEVLYSEMAEPSAAYDGHPGGGRVSGELGDGVCYCVEGGAAGAESLRKSVTAGLEVDGITYSGAQSERSISSGMRAALRHLIATYS